MTAQEHGNALTEWGLITDTMVKLVNAFGDQVVADVSMALDDSGIGFFALCAFTRESDGVSGDFEFVSSERSAISMICLR